MMELFAASIASLALLMVTAESTINLLKRMNIIHSSFSCNKCNINIEVYRTIGNYHHYYCNSCKTKTSILQNCVLSNSNTKMREFVILMYMFCQHHRSYKTVRRETFLPQEGYQISHLSDQTINKWFAYFRHICIRDIANQPPVIGGEGDVVEMDETMCGKNKYGKGDRRPRRRQWVFGGVSRLTGRCFMRACPDNKRTKKALWPIVQAHVLLGTDLITDGWRAYRRLPEIGYPHRWINHDLYYVHPDDATLHTNGIEGLWGKFKRWLPQSGRYNLEEYMWLFMWMEEQRHKDADPFWALVALVAADNSTDTLMIAVEKDHEEKDTEAEEHNSEVGEEEQQDESDTEEEEHSDEEDYELFHWFDCAFCKSIFRKEDDLISHIRSCNKK